MVLCCSKHHSGTCYLQKALSYGFQQSSKQQSGARGGASKQLVVVASTTVQSTVQIRPPGARRSAAGRAEQSREHSVTWVPRAAGASPWPSCRGPRAHRWRRAAPAAAAAAAPSPPPPRRRAPSARAAGSRAPATCSPGRSWLLPLLLRHRSSTSTSRLSFSCYKQARTHI